MKPSIGRIVHYIRVEDSGNICEPVAAIVTDAQDDLIFVTTFPCGTAPVFLNTWVVHESRYAADLDGFWRWPPRVS